MIDDQKMNETQDTQAQPELQACQTELKNLKDSYMHLLADFDNYKKRVIRENARIAFNAQSDIVIRFLPIFDNLSRIFEKTPQVTPELKNWLDGLELINKEIKKVLETLDIKEVQMKSFDPELHEAVAQVEMPGVESGSIIDFVEKGYTFKGNLLRPAKVAVAK